MAGDPGTWAAVQQQLITAVASLHAEPTMFREYLDHNELGLAFETVVEAADAEEADEAWEPLIEAMRLMGLSQTDETHADACAVLLRHQR